ncbi:unnamed protein product [Trichogramma brassicae]|uniref:CCHC-type domain-containing protein n=1 Tax=Trichogramma brassicae TaxID=86971 RepID=A0A6H5IP94_9HYME|nr:unnamed protein product [Trichogramma brassicae]
MATIDSKIKLEYELGKDDWETFVERLELFFFANGITEKKKQAAILLTRVSADTYKLAKNLCHPKLLKDQEFETVKKLLSDHLCPKPSETMERCKFYASKQGPTENLSDFVARLKELSLHCNFEKIETALRDQLVCGLIDHETKIDLFKQSELTFESAFKLALAREKAELNAASTEKITASSSKQDDKINAVKTKFSSRNSRNGKNRADWICYCCGKKGHLARDCRHRHQKCKKCKRPGHLEATCRSQKRNIQHLPASSQKEHTSSDDNNASTASEEEDKTYELNSLRTNCYTANNVAHSESARTPWPIVQKKPLQIAQRAVIYNNTRRGTSSTLLYFRLCSPGARLVLASIVSRDASLISRANMTAARAIYATVVSACVPTRRGTLALIPAMRFVFCRGQAALMLSARMSNATQKLTPILGSLTAILASRARAHTHKHTRPQPGRRVDQEPR